MIGERGTGVREQGGTKGTAKGAKDEVKAGPEDSPEEREAEARSIRGGV